MSSSSKSSNTTNNQTTNYSLQGVQGQNVVAGNGNTVTSTDYGSVNAAIGLAGSAISSNQIVALSSVDHAGEMAEMAVNATSKAWSGATNLVSEKTADAWSGATKLINDASSANADRVQQMAIAVATDGQNLVAKSNEKNLYIIGGVSVAAVLSMIVMARVKK
ncbi:hypothetical protein [Marinomonas primoryensis]|jgi:hypothetical protein|uniref:hypothetical protein n=1 Tax=Marinomonas primoryensis TaxID=178399 RepID=UPI003703CCF3|tara:strand:- start:72553 stop:73041 length:489 start_codon:yes stop_codon:yes gene_type:complete